MFEKEKNTSHAKTTRVAAGKLALAALLMCGCAGVQSRPAATPDYERSQDQVSVTGGTVLASIESTGRLRVFKAIPFAAPPIGSLRWKAPQAVVPWSGVRRADSYAAGCMAGDRPYALPSSILYQDSEAQSEDCLYLNVWTGAAPADSGARSAARRPVMVLVHGGGLMLGSGAQPNYNGTGLASKGAVVVTLNYRLGPLGFLAHPELSMESDNKVSGNYGLQDVLAALQWVQANIEQFGGDASNVTLYSESAGAQLSSVLLASPLAKGLFQRAVIESLASFPTSANTTTLANAETAGAAFGNNLGASSIAALRDMRPQAIMAGTGAAAVTGVIVDGYVLPDQLDKLYAAGQVNDVPLMVGWNADEGTPYPAFATTLATYQATADSRYGKYADAFRRLYPVTTDADVVAMAYAPMRDSFFAWQPWTLARAHAAHAKAKTYLYFFNRRPAYYPDQHFAEQDPPANYGAHHTLEQVYFYNNLERSAPPRAYSDIDRRIADTASTYLVNFARTGNPNGARLPDWPAFTGANGGQSMHIGDRIEAGGVPFRPAFDFYDRFYAESLGRALPF
jgi:para-nitrobenzyl esterase